VMGANGQRLAPLLFIASSRPRGKIERTQNAETRAV
jgi:hypothetical protein